MYISANYIDIKQKQDRAAYVRKEENVASIICDGIGEFKDSAEAAQIVVNCFKEHVFTPNVNISQIVTIAQKKILETGNKEGTTLIYAIQTQKEAIVIGYLGDGGVILMPGNFACHPYTNHPYVYSQLMIPHINSQGQLLRYISHHSKMEELSLGQLEVKLNHPTGDIILLFSDGIGTLAEAAIIKDNQERFWRSESKSIQFILEELDCFLSESLIEISDSHLDIFINKTLNKLKANDYLEDDASLGIIITENVLNYYRTDRYDKRADKNKE